MKMYLVIDIGGTYTKYGYYHQNGECFQHNKYKTIKTNTISQSLLIFSLSLNLSILIALLCSCKIFSFFPYLINKLYISISY